MSTVYQSKLAPPSDWQEFQRMTCDLYRNVWDNQYVQEFGSLGQRQSGVDVFGYVNETGRIEGIQCRCVDKIAPKDIEEEYQKSKAFRPELSRFIFVTTTKRDVKIQKKAAEITGNDKYPCEVVFWDDFCRRLSEHTNVLWMNKGSGLLLTHDVAEGIRTCFLP
jgi:hypothetical protein